MEEIIKIKDKEEKKIYGVNITTLLLISYIAGFIGWVVENIACAVNLHYIDDRHQLFPVLAAYSFGIFILFFVLGTPDEMRIFSHKIKKRNNDLLNNLFYFIIIFFLILVGEMSVGLFFEHVLGIVTWNYNHIPLHITQYTSIPTTFGFSIGVCILMKFIFPFFVNLFNRINVKKRKILSIVLGLLISFDYLYMLLYGVIANKFPSYWKITFIKKIFK